MGTRSVWNSLFQRNLQLTVLAHFLPLCAAGVVQTAQKLRIWPIILNGKIRTLADCALYPTAVTPLTGPYCASALQNIKQKGYSKVCGCVFCLIPNC